MLSYGIEKEQLVATKSLNSLIMQSTKLTTYTIFGAMKWQTGAYGILLGLGVVLGVYIARKHLLSIHLERFRNYTLAIMAFSSVLMLSQGILICFSRIVDQTGIVLFNTSLRGTLPAGAQDTKKNKTK